MAGGGQQDFDEDFDYIVVGAGTAGCVLAARLSEDRGNRVCLIEPGGSEKHPYIQIPALVGAAIMNKRLGWGLETVPQECLDNRRVPLPRGKVIGGSGSINGMAYFRGQAGDYDDWAEWGNPGWSFADVLPYFLRSERNAHFEGSPWHGQKGKIAVNYMPRPNPLNHAFREAMAGLQFPEVSDWNVAEPEGYGFRQGTIERGKRISTATAYLAPARKRRNLVIQRGLARRVLVEGGRCVGVELQTEGGVRRYAANKELVVSAGAYHSPHLLQLSGIGDPQVLRDAGIETVHALPGVGANLHDHPAAGVAMDAPGAPSYGLSWRNLPRNALSVFEYLFTRGGQFGSNLFETTAFIRSRPDAPRPDMQLVFQPARRNTVPFPLPLGHGFAIAAVALYPKSRGTLKPAGPDPMAAPLIDLKMGCAQEDVDVIVAGLKLARRILNSPAFAGWQPKEYLPGSEAEDDEDLRAWIRASATTVHHPAGSCRMGPKSDGMAVVDAELKVHGIAALRVADCSIMPQVIGGNTNAPTVMIAEKCADMMLGIAPPAPFDPRG